MLKIIDSDDLMDAVALTVATGLSAGPALEAVIKDKGRYWFADVRQLCYGCRTSISLLREVNDIAVICQECRQYGKRVHR